MRHSSPRLDLVSGRVRSRLSEREHHTTENSTRRILEVLPVNMGIQISGLRDSGWRVLAATPACLAVPAGLRLAAGGPGRQTALSVQV